MLQILQKFMILDGCADVLSIESKVDVDVLGCGFDIEVMGNIGSEEIV